MHHNYPAVFIILEEEGEREEGIVCVIYFLSYFKTEMEAEDNINV